MQLLTRFKTVVFYGNILRIPTEVQYIAADAKGTVWGFEHKPFISTARPDTFTAARDGRRILLGAAVKWSTKEAANTAWKQSLHECVADERWMIEAAAVLKTAVNLMTDNKPAFAGACLQAVADRIALAAQKNPYWGIASLSQVYREFLQHGAPMLEKDSYAELRLRTRVFSGHTG
uniref:Uncharacterized protein n=1 Tax=Podoviridae sp. ctlpi2 TaxID=2826574 RepID=A0A8S5MLS0_9CAUD|nr:MAG TPA: hypothetical protein [Podoviridae sp. ctlpi2]